MVKKNFYLIMLALLALPIVISCKKEKQIELPEKAVLALSFNSIKSSSITKSSGADFSLSENNETINTLQIMIFNEDGSLDAYKSIDGNGSPIQIISEDTPTCYYFDISKGIKDIVVIANSHDTKRLDTIRHISELSSFTTSLKNESIKDFFMMAVSEKLCINNNSYQLMYLQRVVSRVVLKSIRTDFPGGLKETTITDVKAYLINVNTVSSIKNEPGEMILKNKYESSENSGFRINDALYSSLPNISNKPYNTEHYFYCYPNNSQENKTMFIIEGKIDGITYYYPILICLSPYADIYSLQPNFSFEIEELVITRKGSLSPTEAIKKCDLDRVFNIRLWYTNKVQINF